jgi:catechol 2,3-dioxygenase-like lactoylglutathione lyase family enzyme
MIKTYGLTHLALAVQDAERSARFYGAVFGAVVTHRGQGFVQIETPGNHDVIVLEEKGGEIGRSGGVRHFGFRLIDPVDIDAAADEVERAGGKILDKGEFCPGEPYLFATDPDGYEIEIWYE